MASKGNPRLTIRVPSENLAAYQQMADKHKMDVTDWARGLLDYAAGVGNKPAVPSRTEQRVERRLTQLEQEALDLERQSPFDK